MKYINKTEFEFSNIKENVEMYIYTFITFMIPFTIGHPQLLVGTIVNATLIMAAINLKGYKLIPVIIMPSIAVLLRGLIFGPYTVYLVYMIPLIWIGNALLIVAIKKIVFDMKHKKVIGVSMAVIIKTVFLFVSAFMLVKLSVLPVIFLTAMGVLQLATGVMGAGVGLGLSVVKNKLLN